MAAAAKTLPFQPSSAATVVRTLSHAFSPRHPLRRGRHLLHQPLASCPVAPRGLRRALSLCASAASGGSNGALGEGGREYDYDLLTIGAGSGGMRASRAASSLYGARVAVCEMPFATVASDALGGTSQQFEEAVADLIAAVRDHYVGASPTFRKSFMIWNSREFQRVEKLHRIHVI